MFKTFAFSFPGAQETDSTKASLKTPWLKTSSFRIVSPTLQRSSSLIYARNRFCILL